MEEEKYFRLNVDEQIFKELHDLFLEKKKGRNWWQQVLDDEDLYVNIRKENTLHVYYKGAGVIRGLLLYKRKKGWRCAINGGYLDKEIWPDSKSKKDYSTTPEKIMSDIKNIKTRINENKKSNNNEGKCEDEIKGDLYTKVKGGYIDTEYAFNYSEESKKVHKIGKSKGKPLKIRIDLVTINDDDMIEFVELKRISDGRLHKRTSEPEIVQQMEDYTEFIIDHKKEIQEYYEKVQIIMEKIGVNNPLKDKKIKGVAPEARLFIAEYKKDSKYDEDRYKRIIDIKEMLEKDGIKSNISDIIKSYLQKKQK